MPTWSRPTLPQLLERITGDIAARSEGLGFVKRSIERIFGFVLAGVSHHLYDALSYVRDQQFPQTADIEGLTEWGEWLEVPQKAGAPAAGHVRFPGTAPVPGGTLLEHASGALFKSGAVVDLAQRIYQVTALAVGSAGNLAADTKLTLLSPVVGLEPEATVVVAFSGGDDVEDPEAYRPRVIDALRTPRPSGADGDYERWALSRPGVTRAWEFRRRMGAGTVSLGFVMDERADIIPTLPDVESVQAYIDSVRPGDVMRVLVAAPVANRLRLTIDARGSATQTQYADAVKALLRTDAQLEQPLAVSQLDEALSQVPGEESHTITSIEVLEGASVRAVPLSVSEIVPSSWGILTFDSLTLL